MSLIELIAAVTIFTVLILLATEIFKMVVDGQRSAISAQNVEESVRYALEKINKEIRTAQVSNQECGASAVYKIFNTASGGQSLYFKNKDGQCLTYYLENGRFKVMAGAGPGSDFVTPAKVEVSNLKFYPVDDLIGANHNVQPYVTMVMDVKATGLAAHEQKIKIQTTSSSRYYE